MVQNIIPELKKFSIYLNELVYSAHSNGSVT